MQPQHEISRAWRGAPWGRRLAEDWDDAPEPEPTPPRPWRPLALSVLLGVALGAAIVHGLARDDRARLDALMRAVDAR